MLSDFVLIRGVNAVDNIELHGEGAFLTSLPAVSCQTCCETWMSNWRVHGVDGSLAKKVIQSVSSPTSNAEFEVLVGQIRSLIPISMPIFPGDMLSPFKWNPPNSLVCDMYFPVGAPPCAPLVSSKAANVILAAKLRGVSVVPVQVPNDSAPFFQLICRNTLSWSWGVVEKCHVCGFQDFNSLAVRRETGVQKSRKVVFDDQVPNEDLFAVVAHPGIVVPTSVFGLFSCLDLNTCQFISLNLAKR